MEEFIEFKNVMFGSLASLCVVHVWVAQEAVCSLECAADWATHAVAPIHRHAASHARFGVFVLDWKVGLLPGSSVSAAV